LFPTSVFVIGCIVRAALASGGGSGGGQGGGEWEYVLVGLVYMGCACTTIASNVSMSVAGGGSGEGAAVEVCISRPGRGVEVWEGRAVQGRTTGVSSKIHVVVVAQSVSLISPSGQYLSLVIYLRPPRLLETRFPTNVWLTDAHIRSGEV